MLLVINLFFCCRCVKEFEFKGFMKIKKKKGKDEEKNNNFVVNEVFEGDDDEKYSSQNCFSFIFLLESGDLKKKNMCLIYVSEKKIDVRIGIIKFQEGNDIERGDGCVLYEEELL